MFSGHPMVGPMSEISPKPLTCQEIANHSLKDRLLFFGAPHASNGPQAPCREKLKFLGRRQVIDKGLNRFVEFKELHDLGDTSPGNSVNSSNFGPIQGRIGREHGLPFKRLLEGVDRRLVLRLISH
jgi:hypothetical protein